MDFNLKNKAYSKLKGTGVEKDIELLTQKLPSSALVQDFLMNRVNKFNRKEFHNNVIWALLDVCSVEEIEANRVVVDDSLTNEKKTKENKTSEDSKGNSKEENSLTDGNKSDENKTSENPKGNSKEEKKTKSESKTKPAKQNKKAVPSKTTKTKSKSKKTASKKTPTSKKK
jgi:outer membrane biosynthesis protein TonB